MSDRVALLVGHTDRSPGYCRHDGTWREYDYLHRVGRLVAEHWRGWDDGTVIDCGDDQATSSGGIYERIHRAVAWGGKDCCTVEIHANAADRGAPQDYSLTMYRAGDHVGRQLCEAIRVAIADMVYRHGASRHITVGLPSQLWGRKAAVEDSPCHAVILEPAFATNLESTVFFSDEFATDYARLLARTLRGWATGGIL